MADQDVSQTSSPSTEPAARPRRRSASRPAGPPQEAPAASNPPELAATPQASTPALPAPEVVPPLPELTAAPEPADKPVRKRTPRKKPEASQEALVEEAGANSGSERPKRTRTRKPAAEQTAEAAAAAPAGEEQANEVPVKDSKPKTAQRKRATTKSKPKPEASLDTESAVAEILDATVAQVESQGEPEVLKATKPKHKSKSGASKSSKPKPVEEPEAADDPLAAAIDSLAQTVSGAAEEAIEGAEEILDSLADAIAGALGADDEEVNEEDVEEPESESVEGEGTPRRRRRRGGRRRRRGNRPDGDSEAATEDEDQDAAEESAEATDGEAEGEGDEGEARPSTRRRRRRRRRGEDAGGDDEPGTDVVVKVRDPRPASDSDQVTGIDGSTRLEAKRQRRKESRAAGRRRAPILTEAEFLARREAVDRRMIIRQSPDYTQLAVLEDNVLVEHYVDKASATSLIGNIYLGRVQNVLPSMEAAFIDIGRGRNAVLYAGEIDWDGLQHTGERKVEDVLKSGQSILVQVSKDPVGAKGARLTSHISLPGRYIVYSPGGHLSGISRKLPDKERNRLKDILSNLIGDDASVIVRTAAEGVSEEELVRDVNRLKAQWEVIEKKSKQGSAPQQLYAEPDLTLRIVRDLFTEDFAELMVQGDGSADDAFEAISAYVGHVAPHLADRVKRFDAGESNEDSFKKFRIDEQIAKALDRKVFLPSGGSLIIDRTEAMTVIDVNTGKFTGTGGNLEATVTSNNLEAAEEIVRQLRLRDIGGIIVVDFIDMVLPSNRELLLRRLVECLGRDRTRHQVAEVTSLGLVQLTRKKIGTGLAEAFTEQCSCCGGRGYMRFDEPVESQAPADGGERSGKRRRRGGNGGGNNN